MLCVFNSSALTHLVLLDTILVQTSGPCWSLLVPAGLLLVSPGLCWSHLVPPGLSWSLLVPPGPSTLDLHHGRRPRTDPPRTDPLRAWRTDGPLEDRLEDRRSSGPRMKDSVSMR